jgi:hypothetical protein
MRIETITDPNITCAYCSFHGHKRFLDKGLSVVICLKCASERWQQFGRFIKAGRKRTKYVEGSVRRNLAVR